MTINRPSGYTLLEVLMVLSGLAIIALIYASTAGSFAKISNSGDAGLYLSNTAEIELVLGKYLLDKGDYPTDSNSNNNLLDESSFQYYIFPPKGPDSLDSTVGTNGYRLQKNGTQIYICSTITSSKSKKQTFVDYVTSKTSSGKFFYADACPALINGVVGDGNLQLTYWIAK